MSFLHAFWYVFLVLYLRNVFKTDKKSLNNFHPFSDRVNMNKIKRKLIAEAENKYRVIFPCATRQSLDESFTIEENIIIFWFNTEDDSTHMITSNI